MNSFQNYSLVDQSTNKGFGMSSMNKTSFEPPRCPEYGADLFRVVEYNREAYRFDPETGRCIEVDGKAGMMCPDCEAELSRVISSTLNRSKIFSSPFTLISIMTPSAFLSRLLLRERQQQLLNLKGS